MDFSKVKTWMKKMNQILDLYQENEEFTSTEKALLLDYTQKIKQEIQKLSVFDSEENIEAPEIIPPVESAPKSKAPISTPSIPADPITNQNAATTTESSEYTGELYPELFDHLEVNDVYSKLELKSLTDIKLGMGLNEKILTQNELFNGDKNAFDDIVLKLNQCSDFNSAKLFLCESVIPKYNWTNPTKEKTVDAFIKLVKRRHL